jgi:chromate transporter
MTTVPPDSASAVPAERASPAAVFAVFLKLGLTSFGGPIAHLGYFREAFVVKRRWVSESAYADLVALSQFLPGPASSQVGMALGASQAGIWGGILAWIGFTLPSALAMIAFALGVDALGAALDSGVLHGLKVVAVAVVAQAVWGMARTMAPDRPRATLALAAAGLLMLWPGAYAQLLVIGAGAMFGAFALRTDEKTETGDVPRSISAPIGTACLILFFALLMGLPVLARSIGNPLLSQVDSFYRSGSLIFGGGHVVLPLLQAELVPQGWIGNDAFLAGYGAAQAVPGPLLSFAAYLGAAMAEPGAARWVGGLVCLGAVFLPSFLLIFGALPFWHGLARLRPARAALRGINAAVVGMLLAALYHPVWTSAVRSPLDFALALAAFGLLTVWKTPSWLVVGLTAAGTALLAMG